MKFSYQAQRMKNAPDKKRKEHTTWRRIVAAILVFSCMITSPALSTADNNSNLLLDCLLIVHEHGPECYDEEEKLICGEADYVVHIHTEGCWDEAGNLLCQLPEIAPHEHQESCYDEMGMLICDKLELHTHSPEDCYDLNGQLICEKTVLYEHVHGGGCFREIDAEEAPNDDDNLIDSSGEATPGSNLLLDCPLIVHEHGPECYHEEEKLVCGEADYVVHIHTEGCWDEEENLLCQLPEIAPHEHQESCYDKAGMLICDELDLHTHSPEDCYDLDGQLICEKTVLYEHVHGDGCFRKIELDEPAEEQPEPSDENAELPETPNGDADFTADAGNVTVYVYDDSNVVPEGALLQVSQIVDQEQLDAIEQSLQNAFRKSKPKELVLALAAIYPYDISFVDEEGKGVSLSGNVTVSLVFKMPIVKLNSTGAWKLFHLSVEGETENLETAEIDVDDSAAVKTVTFQSADFSTFVLTDLVEPRDLEEYINSINGVFTYKLLWGGDEIYPDGEGHYTLYPNETYRFSMNIYSTDLYGFESGVYTCWLPREIFDLGGVEILGEVTANIEGVDTVIGTYRVREDGLFTITFSEVANEAINIRVYISFSFTTPPAEEEVPNTPTIKKTGQLDLTDGKYHFTITATIPKYTGKSYYSQWYVRDQDSLDDTFMSSRQSLEEASIVIRYGGERMTLKDVRDVIKDNEDDSIAYYYDYVNDFVYLVNRKENNCTLSLHDQFKLEGGDGWCTHWSLEEDADCIITYATDEFSGESILESGATNYYNFAFLFDRNDSVARPKAEADICLPIPRLIEKTMESPFDQDGVGSYTIVINKDKVNLAEYVDEENRFTIVDEMEGMVFILGTLVITEDDNSTPLTYGTDYIYEWEGEIGEVGKRVLTIYLLRPGAHMYTIAYDVMIDFDMEDGWGILYKNKASLHFPNYDVSSEPRGGSYTESSSSGEGVALTIRKIDAWDESEQNMLSGAVYGLYSADGYEITTGTTGVDGTCRFHTNLIKGIVLRPRVVYYLKELTAPDGYYLDPNEYYFYFSDEKVQEIEDQYPGIKWLGVNGKAIMTLHDMPIVYDLPAAGGIGTLPFYLLGGLLLTGAVLDLGITSRKKRISNS